MFSNKEEPMQTTPERTGFMTSPLKAITSPIIQAVKSAAFRATQEFDRFYDNFQATFSSKPPGSRISKQTPATTERIRSKLNLQKKLNSNSTSLTPYFERHTLDSRAIYRFKSRDPFNLDGFEADDEDTPSLSELGDEDTPNSPLHSESSYQQHTPDELTFKSFTSHQIQESQEVSQEKVIGELQTDTFPEHKQMYELGSEIFADQRKTEENMIEQLEVGKRGESVNEEQQTKEFITVSTTQNIEMNLRRVKHFSKNSPNRYHEKKNISRETNLRRVEHPRRNSSYRHQEKKNISRRTNKLVRSCSELRRQASLLADEISATDLNDVDMEEVTISPSEIESPVRSSSSFRKTSVTKTDRLITPPQSIEYPKRASARSPIRIAAQYQSPQRYTPIRTTIKSTPSRRLSPRMRSASIPSSPVVTPVHSSQVVTPMRSTHIPSSPVVIPARTSPVVSPIRSMPVPVSPVATSLRLSPVIKPTRSSPLHNLPEASPVHSSFIPSSPVVSPVHSAIIPSSPVVSPIRLSPIHNLPEASPVHSQYQYSSDEDASMCLSPEVTPRRLTNIPASPIVSPVHPTIIPSAPVVTPMHSSPIHNSTQESPVHSTNINSSPEESSKRISPRYSSSVQNRACVIGASIPPEEVARSVLLSPQADRRKILMREENSGPIRRKPGSKHDPMIFWNQILQLNARNEAQGKVMKTTPISQRISTLQSNMKKSWGYDGTFLTNNDGVPVSSSAFNNKLRDAAKQPEEKAAQVKKRDIFDDDDDN